MKLSHSSDTAAAALGEMEGEGGGTGARGRSSEEGMEDQGLCESELLIWCGGMKWCHEVWRAALLKQ